MRKSKLAAICGGTFIIAALITAYLNADLFNHDKNGQQSATVASAIPAPTQPISQPAKSPVSAVENKVSQQSSPNSINQVTRSPVSSQANSKASVSLPLLQQAELDRLREEDRQNASKPGIPMREGIVRDIPDDAGKVDLANLTWEPAANGQMVGRFDVESAGALAMRIKLELGPQEEKLSVRYIEESGESTPPESWSDVAESKWSPKLSGSRVTIEISSPSQTPPKAGQIAVTQIGHMYYADLEDPAALKDAKCISDAICQIDTYASLEAMMAVGKLSFKIGTSFYVCTGTLVGKSPTDGFFLTAAHCVSTDEVAATVSTEWGYQKTKCGGSILNKSTTVAGGAVIAGLATTADTALLMLRGKISGIPTLQLSSAKLPPNTFIRMFHHPGGLSKRVTFGRSMSPEYDYQKFENGTAKSTGYEVIWTTDGIALPGSSGSPLLKSERINGIEKYIIYGVNSIGQPYYTCKNTDYNPRFGTHATFGSSASAFQIIGHMLERRAGDYPTGGPLWNHGDAQKICPTACGSKSLTWRGRWKSNSKYSSVCGCE